MDVWMDGCEEGGWSSEEAHCADGARNSDDTC